MQVPEGQRTGTVKWFNEAKGFGFINSEGIEEDIFVHYKYILEDGYKTLYQNQVVTFEAVKTARGLMATKIKKADT